MRPAILRCFLSMVALFLPAYAFACECNAAAPISQRWTYALVATGKVQVEPEPRVVTNTDRILSLTTFAFPSRTIRIAIDRQYKGTPVKEVRFKTEGNNCDAPLIDGASYLIYDSVGDGSSINLCNPPVLLADAAEDLKYITAALKNQPQAILFGTVFTEIPNSAGQRVPAPVEPGTVTVVLDGSPGRFRQVYAGKGLLGFQIVVPPGEYRVWLERKGVAVTEPQRVSLQNGAAVRQLLRFAELQGQSRN